MAAIPFTQPPVLSNIAEPLDSSYLDVWPAPGYEHVSKPPSSIFDKIKNDANGSSISTHMSYLSLGFFYIRTSLLEPHPTQREIDSVHVKSLKDDFVRMRALRSDHPGVVIGLGDGWYEMKKNTPKPMFISANSPHLDHLSLEPKGPIGQIIRGCHRTAAAYLLSKDPAYGGHDYWYYNVLVPGMNRQSN